jgi:hypothetical protein
MTTYFFTIIGERPVIMEYYSGQTYTVYGKYPWSKYQKLTKGVDFNLTLEPQRRDGGYTISRTRNSIQAVSITNKNN